MELRCVVGNCLQPDRDVKRCYWAKDVGMIRESVIDHAYLDLCDFHQTILSSYRHSVPVSGWDSLD